MTPQTALTIATALNTNPFREDYRATPTLNAQAALEKITHYCDPSTLRFHHSRIVGGCVTSCGAFYRVTETCAIDYENTRRGYRVVLFDLTGEAVYRPSLSETHRTRDQATKAFWAWFQTFDELAHYRAKFERMGEKLQRQIQDLRAADQILANQQTAEA